MIKKLKSRAGLTLTELLITTLILSLFSMACIVGISTAIVARRNYIKAADADLLKSSVIEVISQELRLSIKPEILDEGKKIKYSGGLSIEGGSNQKVALKLSDEDISCNGIDIKKGRLVKVIDIKDGEFLYQVMNDSAYGHSSGSASKSELYLADLKFEIVGSSIKSIKVSFKVCDENDNVLAEADGFTVVPLNRIA